MRKTRSRLLLTGTVLLMCTLLAGCGCGRKKAADPETEEVIKISITPEATPTTAPEQVNSDAVVSSNGVTMVNSYLDESAGSTSGNTASGAAVVSDSTASDNASTANGTDSTDSSTSAAAESSDTEGASSDNGDSQDYSEDSSSQDDSGYDDSGDDYSEEY